MSRVFWLGVGAVGGVVVYRRSQRALDRAKERGFIGNVQIAAEATSAVAQGVGRVVALGAASVTDDEVPSRTLRSVQVTPVVRTPVSRRQHGIPATAMKLDALAPVVDVRDGRQIRSDAAG